jgi:adenylate cyclase
MKRRAGGLLQKRLLRGLLVGLAAFALALLIHSLTIIRPLEWNSWDLRVQLFADPSQASRDIVILLIDQYSLDVYAKQQGLPWPWPRQVYSAVIDYLRTGGAKVIFLTSLFPRLRAPEQRTMLILPGPWSGREMSFCPFP